MDKYLELMQLIQQYLNYPNVDSNDEIISAYDLIQVLNNGLHELREAVDRDTLKEKINKRYSPLAATRKLFFKKARETGSVTDKIDFIHFESKDNKSEISVHYVSQRTASLARDFYSKDIYYKYFNKEKDGFLISEFLEDIEAMLDALEKYSIKYQSNISLSGFGESPITKTQNFSDGFLDISIQFGHRFSIETGISINKTADPDDISKREWTNRITVADFIKENKEAILKKIPIYVRDLNPVFMGAIEQKYKAGTPRILTRKTD